MEMLIRDLRQGVRGLVRHPGFTAVAVLSLALAIGANTAIFTAVEAVFLQSLPVREPSRLVRVFTALEGRPDLLDLSYPNFVDLRERSRSFSDLVTATQVNLGLSGGKGESEQVWGEMVSGRYFDMLGVRAALGRTFLPEEDSTPGGHPVVVLSHELWERRFGAEREILGRPVSLDGRSFVVVGVAPRGFVGTAGIRPSELWIPLAMHDQVLGRRMAPFFNERRATLLGAIGRLRDGVSPAQADADLKRIAAALAHDHPDANQGQTVKVMPVLQSQVDPNAREGYVKAAFLLGSVVTMVLLVACFNVAVMLLARANRRRRETALRLALGARRGQLVRQLLAESFVLALAATALGLLLASWSRSLLTGLRTPYLPPELRLGLDARALLFTIGLSVLTPLLFGLVPALQSTRPRVMAAIKGEDRELSPGLGRLGLRSLLIAVQVALSLVSLIGAALFVISLRNAQRIDPGFETGHLLTVSFDLDNLGYAEARGQQALRQIADRVKTLPGARSAAVSETLVLAGQGFARKISVEGRELRPGERLVILPNSVGPGYFETLGIPLLRGRGFTEEDHARSRRVAVINRTMADRLWNGDAVGRRFTLIASKETVEVVGVVQDVKYANLTERPRLAVYFPMSQAYASPVTLQIRTEGDPVLLAAAVRREIHALEPNLALLDLRTMTEVIGDLLWIPRTGATLLGFFGLLTLVLVMIGIHGVMQQSVTERRREIGIRLALGAERSRVIRLLFNQSMITVVAGLAAGLGAAFLLSPFVATLLFGVGARNSLAYLLAALFLAVVAALATYIPARRVTAISPMIVMRQE